MRQLIAAKCRYGSGAALSTLSGHVGYYPDNDQTGDPPGWSRSTKANNGTASTFSLFEDPISDCENPRRYSEPKCFGGLGVDDEFEFRGLFYWHFSGPCPFEDFVDINGGQPEHVRQVAP